jgi:GAF domain-containing protein
MKPSAFTDDLAVMQVLADLIAAAIKNARLFAESKQALDATKRAYEISHRAWMDRLEE